MFWVTKIPSNHSALINEEDNYFDIINNRESGLIRQEREKKEELKHEKFTCLLFNRAKSLI